ncbi:MULTISPECIES: DUF3043 domain-containing protein [Actinomycetes]|uniref:DUF3043 domain-containing protein n=1 Tax=Williamsia marianensis TaxID=85044 RepID=A0A2G3PJP9_WILMA|nr:MULTISPECIES: DUF3043 domain-containing protein [Actinomycetes]PHV66020.1 DUF3043 domain-containing protein [Williamsia marianensis]PZT96224.1 MAG: DUF3043 domain-containing protein [Gordonia sp. (in: high G+C Gram-positive bacteria)]
MKLPWKKDDVEGDTVDTTAGETTVEETAGSRRYTEGKGRPTPKRRDAQGKRRGPVSPAPLTRAEARARKKELKGSNVTLTKAEKKDQADARRQQRADQRQKMMEGDERYLMPRDKGEVRRYARDIVDSRRNFAGMFMPFAILLIIVMFVPAIAVYATLLMLVFVIFLVIDGVLLGRILNNRVRERFPSTEDGGFKLGWYGFSRAMQLRFMRAPKPRVKPGDAV